MPEAPVRPTVEVRHLTGGAADLHARPLRPLPATRLVERLDVDGPALVLGSTQPAGDVDEQAAAAAGVTVARRRSGGGAVLLVPGAHLWVDLTIGRDDPCWDDDVGRAAHWVGAAWVAALAGVGVQGERHAGRPVDTAWSRRVCFAGLGAGEVRVGGRKVVGVSQRRTRDGARFQCLVLRHWDPAPLLALLRLGAAERAAAAAALGGAAAGVDVAPAVLLDALVDALA